jgi:hypothetical protein
MATSSFDTNLVLDSDEVAQRFIDAIDSADQNPPIEYVDVRKMLENSKVLAMRLKLE